MKKFFKSKKWIAFFLALLLVMSTSITSSDAFLWAAGGQEEDQVNGNAPVNDNETGELVQQVINVSKTDQPVVENPEEQPTEVETDKLTEDETEEEVLDEENAMDFALFGTRPLADETEYVSKGSVTKEVSDPWEFSADKSHDSYSWGSSAPSVISAGGTGKATTGKAQKAGNATITCTAKTTTGLFFKETKTTIYTWDVTVKPKVYTTTETTDVYGSLNITGIDGAESAKVAGDIIRAYAANKDAAPANNSWYDLGSKSVGSLPGITYTVHEVANDGTVANGVFSPDSEPDTDAVKGKFDDKLLDMASNIELKPENGAGSYVSVVADPYGKLTWHFDVHVDVSKMYCTVKYVDQNGVEIDGCPSQKVWGMPGTEVKAETYKKDIDNLGYTYVAPSADSVKITKDGDQVLELRYKDNTTTYTVERYYESGGRGVYNAPETETREAEAGESVTLIPANENKKGSGYVWDDQASNVLSSDAIAEDGSTVLKVYFKQQFTVKYMNDGTIVKEDASLDYGDKSTPPDDPKQEGNAFRGWKVEGTADSAIVENIKDIEVTQDVTYVAVWTEGSNLYTYVKFILGGEELKNNALKAEELAALEQYFGLNGDYRWNDKDTGILWYPIGRIKNYPHSKPAQGENDSPENWTTTKTEIEQGWSSEMDEIKLGGTETNTVYKNRIWEKAGDQWSVERANGANHFDGIDEAALVKDGGSYVWHLNGSVDLQKSVRVEYVDENGTAITADKVAGLVNEIPYAVFRTIDTQDDRVVTKGAIDGYRYSSAWVTVDGARKDDPYSIQIGDNNIAIVLQYEKTYQVTYEGGTDGYLTEDETKTEFVDSTWYAENDTVTVEADDLFTNSNSNLVFAEWEAKDSNGNKITINNGTFIMPKDYVTITAKWKGLTADKRALEPADGVSHKLGETIHFDITVTNIGDIALTNVTVSEKLEGAKIEKAVKVVDGRETDEEVTLENLINPTNENPGTLAQATIASLAVGESVMVKASYVVQETDLGNGSFKNTATVGAEGLTDKTISTGDDEISMDDVAEQLTVIKKLVREDMDDETSAPVGANGENNTFKIGDTAEFDITVTNSGNQTLRIIKIAEALDGAVLKEAGNPIARLFRSVSQNNDGSFTIDELKPGETVKFTATYQIKDTDAEMSVADKADFRNVLNVTRTIGGTEDTVQVGSDSVIPLADLYTLTVQYVYSDGTQAAATVESKLHAGDPYTIATPAIAGYNSTVYYNSSIAAVTGTMPGNNMVIRVVYTAPATTGGGGGGEVTPTTPPTPPTTPEPVVIPPAPVPAGAIVVEVPADLVPVEDEEVPLQGARIDIDEDGNAEVVPIEEEEIPLAGMPEILRHCILHFLLLLAAVLMFVYHMVSTQRRQRKLDDMRDQLSGR